MMLPLESFLYAFSNASPPRLETEPRFTGEDISVTARAFFILIGVMEVISGGVGNILLIIAMHYVRTVGVRSFHVLFLVNLALADCLTLGYWMTFTVLDLIFNVHPVVNGTHCVFNAFLIYACRMTYVVSLMGISLDRYIHVCHIQLYRRVFTKEKTFACCLLIWLFGAAMAFPPLVGVGAYGYNPINRTCSFIGNKASLYCKTVVILFCILPVLTIGVCNIAIFRYWKRTRLEGDCALLKPRHKAQLRRILHRIRDKNAFSQQTPKSGLALQDERVTVPSSGSTFGTWNITQEERESQPCTDDEVRADKNVGQKQDADDANKLRADTYVDSTPKGEEREIITSERQKVEAAPARPLPHGAEASGRHQAANKDVTDTRGEHKENSKAYQCLAKEKHDVSTAGRTRHVANASDCQPHASAGTTPADGQSSAATARRQLHVDDATQRQISPRAEATAERPGNAHEQSKLQPLAVVKFAVAKDQGTAHATEDGESKPRADKKTAVQQENKLWKLKRLWRRILPRSAETHLSTEISMEQSSDYTWEATLRLLAFAIRDERAMEHTLVRALFVVFLLMLISYVPFGIGTAIEYAIAIPLSDRAEAYTAITLLLFMNCAVNWIVYGVMNLYFRREYYRLFQRFLRICRRNGTRAA